MTNFFKWPGAKVAAASKLADAEFQPSASVDQPKVPMPDGIALHELHHPVPVPDVVEKNSESIWAEFESVVPYKNPQKSQVPPQDNDWLDTVIPSEYADTVRGEFDDS